jgi:putative oxidoreductase
MAMVNNFRNVSLLLMRIILAGIFINAGYAKIMMWSTPMEGMSSAMVLLMKFLAIAEPIGGLALLIGLWTRSAALCLAIIMAGANYFVYSMGAPLFTGLQGIGLDYTLLLFASCLMVAAFGPGRWSVDATVRGKACDSGMGQ